MFNSGAYRAVCAVVLLCSVITHTHAADKIRFGLSWLPQAEMCGFYQALATGLYKKAGLDVELVPGGPDRNIPLLVATNQLEMGMGSSFSTINMKNNNIQAQTVAAYLQKSPQTLVAHADQGISTLADLKGKPMMIAKFSQFEFWQFLKQKHGFSDDQLRPYTYSAAPFLNDPKAIQQGYVTEDALMLGKVLPKPPVSILLADYGYRNYASTVYAMKSFIDANEKTVAAFVEASGKGWQECLQGNYKSAMQAVMVANPQHGEELFHYKMKQMRTLGLLESEDTKKYGTGAMSDAHWKEFFEVMSAAGVYPKDLDYKAAYTLKFSNRARSK
jgi:NitT/TauT family transport system substrate-binding protein